MIFMLLLLFNSTAVKIKGREGTLYLLVEKRGFLVRRYIVIILLRFILSSFALAPPTVDPVRKAARCSGPDIFVRYIFTSCKLVPKLDESVESVFCLF